MDPRAESTRAGYATIAPEYAARLGGELARKPLDRSVLDAFAESISRGGFVVDVGCGPGQVAAYLAARGGDVVVEGLDLSPEMIRQAARCHPALRFQVGDMFALPYADTTVAGIVSFYSIVHTPNQELVRPFHEFYRVLRAGGLVAVAFHVGEGCTHVDELWGCATSLDFWFHRPEAVIATLEASGFVIEARLDRAPYPDVEHPSHRSCVLARRR